MNKEDSMFNEKVESVEKKNFFQKVRDYVNPDNSIAFLCEADSSESSGVNDSKDYDGWTLPIVPFKKCQEYYLTVGKVQNTVESFINQVINRDWYFDSDENSENDIKKLKEWETKYHLSTLFENIVRDWLQCGNSIIGKSDYLPVQIETIIGLKRDASGIVSAFGQARGDKIIPLQADKYFHSKYITLSRGAWGLSLYNSLMTTFTDIDGKQSVSQLALYRQSIQDNSKIHHRMGSPKSIWFFDVPDNIMKNHIKPLVKRMKHGDRLLLNKKPEMITETVDGKTRFTEATQQLSDEIDTGLQSSSSRLITQPSAMADAGEAGEQDDERVKGIMEKLRRFMDEVIIPHVLGKSIEQCKVSFKWGTKDSFKLSYPDGLRNLLIDGVIDEDIVRHILTKRLNWDLPEDMVKKLINKPKVTTPQLPSFFPKKTDNKEEDPNMESLTLDLLKILLNKQNTE